jgi:hypothetical protein
MMMDQCLVYTIFTSGAGALRGTKNKEKLKADREKNYGSLLKLQQDVCRGDFCDGKLSDSPRRCDILNYFMRPSTAVEACTK